jgi:hypothetical protein
MTRRRAADCSAPTVRRRARRHGATGSSHLVLLVSLGVGVLLVPLGLLAVVLLVLAGEDASAPCLPAR